MKLVSSKQRLIQCYKYKIRIPIFEDTFEENGILKTESSTCPKTVCGNRETRPFCNGLNEWGNPCPYAFRLPKDQ